MGVFDLWGHMGFVIVLFGLSDFGLVGMFNQEAETKAKNMEEELGTLQMRLEERNAQLQASASTAEKVPLISKSFFNYVSFSINFFIS